VPGNAVVLAFAVADLVAVVAPAMVPRAVADGDGDLLLFDTKPTGEGDGVDCNTGTGVVFTATVVALGSGEFCCACCDVRLPVKTALIVVLRLCGRK